MTPRERFLRHRIHEEYVWLRLHADPHTTEEDVLAYLRDQCGFADGACRYASSEYCVLDCPYRPEEL